MNLTHPEPMIWRAKLTEDYTLSFRWNGAHTVDVYRGKGRWPAWENIDVFTVGPFTRVSASEEAIEVAIQNYIETLLEEE